ncbi:hypothetical protein CXG81DRAFT_26056 [Caulochytrium protostelioides]|uniref:Uncharacterized protein n=1 Tax=Caulochytrium protostelioides TaxID=1555241 RepID=A0A4V1IUP2_9FUNG|nr:hypothetical protein CXG81DRAFT_26056 [Caulochytrium protostelioides]|eukprot:RKP01249.1 hypothetical protein CXG81DRAFT_26056 [Caulochytrium protostelioides]
MPLDGRARHPSRLRAVAAASTATAWASDDDAATRRDDGTATPSQPPTPAVLISTPSRTTGPASAPTPPPATATTPSPPQQPVLVWPRPPRRRSSLTATARQLQQVLIHQEQRAAAAAAAGLGVVTPDDVSESTVSTRSSRITLSPTWPFPFDPFAPPPTAPPRPDLPTAPILPPGPRSPPAAASSSWSTSASSSASSVSSLSSLSSPPAPSEVASFSFSASPPPSASPSPSWMARSATSLSAAVATARSRAVSLTPAVPPRPRIPSGAAAWIAAAAEAAAVRGPIVIPDDLEPDNTLDVWPLGPPRRPPSPAAPPPARTATEPSAPRLPRRLRRRAQTIEAAELATRRNAPFGLDADSDGPLPAAPAAPTPSTKAVWLARFSFTSRRRPAGLPRPIETTPATTPSASTVSLAGAAPASVPRLADRGRRSPVAAQFFLASDSEDGHALRIRDAGPVRPIAPSAAPSPSPSPSSSPPPPAPSPAASAPLPELMPAGRLGRAASEVVLARTPRSPKPRRTFASMRIRTLAAFPAWMDASTDRAPPPPPREAASAAAARARMPVSPTDSAYAASPWRGRSVSPVCHGSRDPDADGHTDALAALAAGRRSSGPSSGRDLRWPSAGLPSATSLTAMQLDATATAAALDDAWAPLPTQSQDGAYDDDDDGGGVDPATVIGDRRAMSPDGRRRARSAGARDLTPIWRQNGRFVLPSTRAAAPAHRMPAKPSAGGIDLAHGAGDGVGGLPRGESGRWSSCWTAENQQCSLCDSIAAFLGP